jgi:flagellar basal body rod protein FlgF
MIYNLLKITTISLMILGVSGCLNEVKEQNMTEKVVMTKQNELSAMYIKELSIISGRLDGMNKAIVQGLTETLDTARLAREMAEKAIASVERNQKLLKELQGQVSGGEAEDGEGGGDEEEAEGGDDF